MSWIKTKLFNRIIMSVILISQVSLTSASSCEMPAMNHSSPISSAEMEMDSVQMKMESTDMKMDHSAHLIQDVGSSDLTKDHQFHQSNQYTDNSSNSNASDCCQSGNSCFMSSCLFFAIANQLTSFSALSGAQSSANYHKMVEQKTIDSLYRPPILS